METHTSTDMRADRGPDTEARQPGSALLQRTQEMRARAEAVLRNSAYSNTSTASGHTSNQLARDVVALTEELDRVAGVGEARPAEPPTEKPLDSAPTTERSDARGEAYRRAVDDLAPGNRTLWEARAFDERRCAAALTEECSRLREQLDAAHKRLSERKAEITRKHADLLDAQERVSALTGALERLVEKTAAYKEAGARGYLPSFQLHCALNAARAALGVVGPPADTGSGARAAPDGEKES